jgi:hypothetical protein
MKYGILSSRLAYAMAGSFLALMMASCPPSNQGNAGGRQIGHDSVDADAIPAATLALIEGMDVYFEHASVGSNIQEGLASLASANQARYGIAMQSIGSDDAALSASDTAWFATNDGLMDNARGNPGFDAKATRFDSRLRAANFAAALDVASFKFCYIDNDYAGTAQQAFDRVRTVMEGLEASYPNATFVWWTMPLETSGNAERDAYNGLVRAYCSANRKWLLDIADIESHNPSGAAQSDDAGERLYSGFTTDGGHLNAAGSRRVASAYWVLLAGIANGD